MKQSSPWFSEEQGDQQSDEHETEMDDTQKLGAKKSKRATSTISVENTAPTEQSDTTANPAETASETPAMPELPASQNDVPAETDETPTGLSINSIEDVPISLKGDVPTEASLAQKAMSDDTKSLIASFDTDQLAKLQNKFGSETLDTAKMESLETDALDEINSHKLLGVSPTLDAPVAHPKTAQKG